MTLRLRLRDIYVLKVTDFRKYHKIPKKQMLQDTRTHSYLNFSENRKQTEWSSCLTSATWHTVHSTWGSQGSHECAMAKSSCFTMKITTIRYYSKYPTTVTMHDNKYLYRHFLPISSMPHSSSFPNVSHIKYVLSLFPAHKLVFWQSWESTQFLNIRKLKLTEGIKCELSQPNNQRWLIDTMVTEQQDRDYCFCLTSVLAELLLRLNSNSFTVKWFALGQLT